MANAEWEGVLASTEGEAVEELLELLRIPSVSTEPARAAEVRAAAGWVRDRLERAGFPDSQVVATDGHPVVIARWQVADALPTVLIYGHYDVQPEDPIELWESPPFAPVVKDGRIFARGAADMKGNLLTAIHGVEASAAANGGQPAINVVVIFEGEEEIGSPSLRGIVRKYRDLLEADVVLSADGGQYAEDMPSQTVARKGLAGIQVNIRAANSDLHSGRYGAYVPNAARSAGELIASFHDADERVAVEGFYDRVVELTAAERAEAAATAEDDEATLRSLEIPELWGEAGYTPQERQWARPTLDINGVWSGFQGVGSKTVTPAEAHIKITTRLVPDQDPDEIIELIRAHVLKHRPRGTRVDIVGTAGSARPYVLDRTHPIYTAVDQALTRLYGRPPVVQRAGGTIPATAIFLEELGLHTIGYAWSAPDSRSHAPNEWYGIAGFLRGRRGYAMLLEILADREEQARLSAVEHTS